MTDFQLTPPEPEQLPAIRITDWSQMVGRTVRAVVHDRYGQGNSDTRAVIVFECDSWATLVAEEPASCGDGVDLRLCKYYGSSDTPADFLTPLQLLQTRLVNQGQYEHLQKIADDKAAAIKAQRAERLRRELATLEGSK